MKIKVSVRANSSREDIIEGDDGKYKVYLKKRAVDNKANLELVKFLKKYFRHNVKILKGHTSKNKLLEIDDEN